MPTSITVGRLQELINKLLIVQIDVSAEGDGEEDFQEVEGKLLAVNQSGIVVKQRGQMARIINFSDILDIEEIDKPTVKNLIKRWRRVIEVEDVRQHLIDHHGKRMDQVLMLTPDEALALHDKIDHEPLGHGHGEKPRKRARRKNVGPEVADVEDYDDEVADDDDDDDDDNVAGESDVVPSVTNVIPFPKQPQSSDDNDFSVTF